MRILILNITCFLALTAAVNAQQGWFNNEWVCRRSITIPDPAQGELRAAIGTVRFNAEELLHAQGEEPSAIFISCAFFGWISHNLGVVQLMRFVKVVFRPQAVWANVLTITAGVVLWSSWAIYALQGGLPMGTPRRALPGS